MGAIGFIQIQKNKFSVNFKTVCSDEIIFNNLLSTHQIKLPSFLIARITHEESHTLEWKKILSKPVISMIYVKNRHLYWLYDSYKYIYSVIIGCLLGMACQVTWVHIIQKDTFKKIVIPIINSDAFSNTVKYLSTECNQCNMMISNQSIIIHDTQNSHDCKPLNNGFSLCKNSGLLSLF